MNSHIFKYCKQFVESDVNPRFAIFIKGPWGVGKSFFIERLLSDLKMGEHEYIVLSLYGVKSSEDIDMKIYQAVHPILSSKGMQIASAVLKSAIKIGTTVELNQGPVKCLDFSFEGGDSSGKKKNNFSKKLVIVDDVERSEMDISEIFGYFSPFITESDSKIVFVGNEEKINDFEKYKLIKEKVVGQEFQIKPCYEDAIESFLDACKFPVGVKEDVSSTALGVARQISCENLRAIRTAVFNLYELRNFLKKDLEEDDRKTFLTHFFVLFLQKSLGLVGEKDDLQDVLRMYYKTGQTYDKFDCLDDEEKKYFNYVGSMQYWPLRNRWNEIIFEGRLNEEEIYGFYKSEKNELKRNNEKKTLFVLLGSWRSLDSVSFKSMYEKVVQEFRDGVYLHPGEILHYADTKLLFIEKGILNESKENVLSEVKTLLNIKTMESVHDFNLGHWEGYAGFGYMTSLDGFKDVFNLIKQFSDSNYAVQIREAIKREVETLSRESIKNFCKNLFHVNGSNKYHDLPVLSLMDVNVLFSKMKQFDYQNQLVIIEAFEERYGKRYSNGNVDLKYKDDIKNLKELKSLYEKSKDNRLFNPQACVDLEIAEKIGKLIEYFEGNVKKQETA